MDGILTDREISCLTLLSLGYSVEKISKTLHYSKSTIHQILSDIRETLEARNNSHSVAIAYRKGLIK